VGLQLAEQYRQMLIEEPLEILTEAELAKEQEASWQRQRNVEASDTLSFEEFLKQHGGS
jgi:glutamate--cysteine ligase